MTPPPRAEQRFNLPIASALIIACAPLGFLYFPLVRASYAGVGRDQGIFQGTAWAIAHGAVLYRDLREINGPLVHELHWLAGVLFGLDPHVLRSFDLVGSALAFACFGAALPGATQQAAEARPQLERWAWAAAGVSALLGQYLAFYDYWRITQRESFFDWFVLLGFAAVLRARTSQTERAVRTLLVLAGIVSATPWFGKPQCALYTGLHFVCLAGGGACVRLPLARRLRPFALGLLLGCCGQLAFLLRHADVLGFVRIYFGENPSYYRYIWPRFLDDIVSLSHHVQFYPIALVLPLIAAGLVALRALGPHVLGLASFPVLAIALDVFQRKAFSYHLHPVTAGAAALALALVCHVATEVASVAQPNAALHAALGPLSAAAGIAYFLARALVTSPYLEASWPLSEVATPEVRATASYLAHFDTETFAGSGMVQAGTWLKRHTQPNDRIQLYGMDPYLLALAERHSATPYIYSIDLNPDAVIEGIVADHGSSAARARARAIAQRNVRDFSARIAHAPPAAFVFFDKAPFMHPSSGFDEFVGHVPELAALLDQRYRELPAFGLVHVYAREDRFAAAAAAAAVPPGAAPRAQSRGSGTPPVSSK